jgi:hypothetical protein
MQSVKSRLPLNGPILVTGSIRSGTTWVGRTLHASGQTTYVSEPLNVHPRIGVMGAKVTHRYTYICDGHQEIVANALRRTAALDYNLRDEARAINSVKDALRMLRDAYRFGRGRLLGSTPILKDPFAVFSVEWFARVLNCRIVIVVRRPQAFVASLKRLGWRFNFVDLRDQPALMRERLEPYRQEMEGISSNDIVAQGMLLWRMIYDTAWDACRRCPEFITVRHEDLCREPVQGFHVLYDRLGLTFSPAVEAAILASTNAGNPTELSPKLVHSTKLYSRASLDNWRRTLSPQEVDRIRASTWDTFLKFYAPDEWS